MSEIALAKINSFAPIAAQTDFPGSPLEEPVFILTSSQLQDLVTQAIQKGLQPLQDEVAALREERDQDRRELAVLRSSVAALEARVTLQEDNGLIQLRLINSLREDGHQAPESAAPVLTKKTQDHITEIAHILGAKEKRLIEGQAARPYVDKLRKEGMTFSQLANVLGLTVDRIRQLSRIAATDQRFNITWHPRKKNTKIIKLRRWDALGL
jgi:DNA-directed RNA polymerase sigma subunit (sigma70/sigma32)